jgi:putative DNA primase/helicase
MNAAIIAKALSGKKVGDQWLCRCPAHDDHDPSLAVRDSKDGRLLVYCYTGCNARDILAALRQRGLNDDSWRDRQPAHFTPKRPQQPQQQLLNPDKPRWLFDHCGQPIAGSPVGAYLRHRVPGLVLPSHEVIRYFPATPPTYPFPSMVALVTDLADANRVITLHFTELLADGSGKAPVAVPKRTLAGYSMKGGVIRLTDDAEVTLRLGFAEGVEKALSIMTSYARDLGRVEHVWAALNAPNMAELPVVAGIETLVIYGDANDAGRRAKDRLAQRWLDAGREVLSGEPPCGDWDEYNGR